MTIVARYFLWQNTNWTYTKNTQIEIREVETYKLYLYQKYKNTQIEIQENLLWGSWTQERRDDRGQVSFLWQCLQAKRPFMHPKIQNTQHYTKYKVYGTKYKVFLTKYTAYYTKYKVYFAKYTNMNEDATVARCHFSDNAWKQNGPSVDAYFTMCTTQMKVYCTIYKEEIQTINVKYKTQNW